MTSQLLLADRPLEEIFPVELMMSLTDCFILVALLLEENVLKAVFLDELGLVSFRRLLPTRACA